MLAAELLTRGVQTRIIDKGDGVVLQTRALGVHARTLEMLDAMGLAEQFVDRGHKVRHTRMYSSGKPLVDVNFALNGSRFDFMLDIPQHETESILRQRVADLGGIVEGGTELVSLHQEADRVIVRIKHIDSTTGEEISADYVVGCDGAHSRVRHELGLTFDGQAYQEDWLLADVLMDWSRSEDSVHAFFRPDGLPMICFPMRDHVWRLVFPYTGNRNQQAPILQEIQQLVDQRAPEAVSVSNPTWLANFRCSLRSTNAYRCGRVMLAGDAAHVHSPAGRSGNEHRYAGRPQSGMEVGAGHKWPFTGVAPGYVRRRTRADRWRCAGADARDRTAGHRAHTLEAHIARHLRADCLPDWGGPAPGSATDEPGPRELSVELVHTTGWQPWGAGSWRTGARCLRFLRREIDSPVRRAAVGPTRHRGAVYDPDGP